MTRTSGTCTLPRMDIKERISELLLEQGKNMTQLASHCGVSPQAVQQWIGIGRMPRPERLRQIADFFGIETADLFSIEPADKSETEDELAVVLDLIGLYRQVPAPLRPSVYKAMRRLIIEVAGLGGGVAGAANDKS
jgi:transcriptional regulator with XRE-family HTH domain